MFHRKKRKLRVDILTIFLSLFVTTVLVIIYYTRERSNEAIINIGNSLIENANEAIVTKLDNFLRPTAFIYTANFLLEDSLLDIADMASLSSFMHIILESYPQLTSVYVADIKGNFFIENRYLHNPIDLQIIPFIRNKQIPTNTVFISQSVSVEKNGTLLTQSYKDSQGHLIKKEIDTKLVYDPRQRPWYIAAQKSKSPDEPWIGVYQFFGSSESGISIAFPIYVNNKLTGVAAADLSMDLIAEQLKKFSIDDHSAIFIVNDHGKIIAQKKDLTTKLLTSKLLEISEIQNPLITTAYNIYQKTGKKQFTFTLKKATYIANFTHYAFSQSESWEIVNITPTDAFIGSLKSAHERIVFFSFFMLLIGLVFVFISSYKISKPIMRLATETKDIIQLNFKKTKLKTHIYEIQVMINALNATKSALSSFVKYVPKTLVAQLLKSDMIAEVGGKKQNITVLFTDITNFTEITEQTNPEQLMIHLSAYLNILTQCIQHNQGNIDKYIGDAIMAFWGAPLDDPDHIAHACQAALDCQREVHRINKQWEDQGKPILKTRFGLNAGDAIVGNMGSSDRLNYTALGDTVNLASRLEALNKTYQTEIIVSESVYKACSDKFIFKPLGTVQVRGKHQTTTIYELIGHNKTSGG